MREIDLIIFLTFRMKWYAVLTVLIGQIYLAQSEPSWEDLRVTWGFPVTTKGVFTPMPLDEYEAFKQGYSQINDKCVQGNFLGNRYIKNNDPSVILIYDNDLGKIAGIQTALPKNEMDKVNTVIRIKDSPAHHVEKINGKEYYVQTAYFIEPSKICKGVRSEEEFKRNIGTNLYLQNGTNPLTDYILIPKYEAQIADTLWTKGGCFPTMGQHYWYDITTDKDCKYFFQAFLLYNHGKLTGFGFANPGFFTSTRFEHPPIQVLEKFIVPLPTCIPIESQKSGGFSTMHVFFNSREENLKC